MGEELNLHRKAARPLPRLRDSMICVSDVFSSEDFLADIFNTTTFTISPGRMSWASDAWKVDDEFRKKWQILFPDSERRHAVADTNPYSTYRRNMIAPSGILSWVLTIAHRHLS